MKSKINFHVLKSFRVFLLIFFSALAVSANVPAPSQGGTLTGVPEWLENVRVRRENLTIDFRPVASGEGGSRVVVEAVFEVENTDEADKPVALIFVLGSSGVGDFEFYLDDRKIQSRAGDYRKLSDVWKSSVKTMWRDERAISLYPSTNLQGTAAFDLVIPKGAHTLKARYKIAPASYYGLAPQMLYQFAYVLEPARGWSDFGGLDLTVHLPEGWEVVANPKMEQKGATIQTHFDQIPAEALAFTFGKPLPPGYHRLNEVFFWLSVLSVFFPPVLLAWFFIRQYRRGSIHPAMGFLLSLFWAILVGVAGFAAGFGAAYFYPVIKYGYGDIGYFFLACFLSAAVFIGGGLVWLIAALIFNNRKKNL